MKKSKERYIPSGAQKIAHKLSDAVAYIYERNNVVYGLVFYGKQSKPVFHYRFKSEASRAAEIAKAFESRQKSIEFKKAEKAKRLEWVPGFEIGDLFRSSWGYDQTNIDYYEVVAVSGKMLTLRKIAQEREETGWEQGKCVPVPGQYIGEAFRKLAQSYSAKGPKDGYISIASYANAYYMKPIEYVGKAPVYEASHWTSYA